MAKLTPPNLLVDFRAATQECRIEQRLEPWMSRNAATARVVLAAFQRAELTGRLPDRDLRIPVYTNDRVERPPPCVHFTYCVNGGSPNEILVPDFVFGGWPECGIGDYDGVAMDVARAGDRPPDDDRLFWIGNVDTHPVRAKLVATPDPRIRAEPIVWKDRVPGQMHGVGVGHRYVPLPDHCRHRFLIDLQGRSWSARLKLLLFSNRALFIQDRRPVEYWHGLLRPFEHYVPVRADLSDLGPRLDWAVAHPDECAAIARSARDLALSNLLFANAVDRMTDCLSLAAEQDCPAWNDAWQDGEST